MKEHTLNWKSKIMSTKTGKTAYEVRLEVLKLSRDILDREYSESNKDGTKSVTPPTVESIVKHAAILNEFVSNTTQGQSK